MSVSRRGFLKGGAAAGVALALPPMAPRGASGGGQIPAPPHKPVGTLATVCAGCAVGCGQLVGVAGGRVVNVEGDPEHPINRGSLCGKGAASVQAIYSDRRAIRPMVRAPGSDRWEERSWDWMLDRVARRIKETRDRHFVRRNADGVTVNRLEAVALLGGAQNTNEEVYLWVKAARGLGIVHLEHQARL